MPGAAACYLQVVPQFSMKKARGIEKGAVKAYDPAAFALDATRL